MNPLGLLGLLGVAAVLGLHLYRRRRPPVVVSALFLWEETPSAAGGGRTREPLRRTLSLIAELFCALFLTLALAGPRIEGASKVRHYVAVIDGSASMHAELGDASDERSSARDRARAHVRRMIEQLPQDARVSLILTGPEPDVIAGPFALAGEALTRLEEAWPTFGEHAATGALLLAAELAGDGTVDFITDGAPAVASPTDDVSRIRHVAVGEAQENIGITGAMRTSARPTSDEDGSAKVEERGSDEVRVVVQNHGTQPRSVELVGGVAGAPLDAAPLLSAGPLSVSPGQSRTVEWNVPTEAPTLIVRLIAAPAGADEASNALLLDDRAVLAPPPTKRLRLASTLDAAAARALGLREGDSAERWASILPDAVAVAAGDAPHLVIGRADGTAETAGATEPRPWRLQLAAPAAEPTDLIGPYLLDRNPLLRGVSFDGVIWSLDEARNLPTASDTVLAFAGDIPLIALRVDQDGARTWTLRLDPVRSTLGRSTDWPIVLANAAEERRRALPGPERTQLGLGERFLWRGAPFDELTLTSPSGAARTYAPVSGPGSDWITPRLGEIGLWTVTHPLGEPLDASGTSAISVGVSLLSAAESNLADRADGVPPRSLPDVGSTDDDRGANAARISPVRALLALLALGFLALDWWALARARGGAG
ncbi:MAG: BatA and WFA domain-containing protein [Planctomycetota bacterium]